MTEFIASNSMSVAKRWHRPPLVILAEMQAIEQEILEGIEDLEGMMR